MTYREPILPSSTADALLMDVARRIQLSPTKHDEAEQHYQALCAYVDRPDSPLHQKVIACYPGGSFATGTAIASRVSKDQHDVDVVIELDISPFHDPADVLKTLFIAINGTEGSRYYGRVTLNSRCVTVTYEDGTRVDLMPIARLANVPLKAGHLFHWRRETGDSYQKPVNPWGFAQHFNREVAFDPVFANMFDARRQTADDTLAKAEADPLPDRVPLSEKSSRVVALQLLKRNRDVRYRSREGRKPPSVVLAAMALDIGPARSGLVDEVINIASHIGGRLQDHIRRFETLVVRNPSFQDDIFTDRWPGDVAAQNDYMRDLDHLQRQLGRLRSNSANLTEMRIILDDLFGETAAGFAIERFLDASRREAESGAMRIGSTGRVLTGSAAIIGAATSAAARPSTNMGGGCIPG